MCGYLVVLSRVTGDDGCMGLFSAKQKKREIKIHELGLGWVPAENILIVEKVNTTGTAAYVLGKTNAAITSVTKHFSPVVVS